MRSEDIFALGLGLTPPWEVSKVEFVQEPDKSKTLHIYIDFLNNFDIVICDVPCSGIGVIKNKPEIKYKITDKYIESIAALQYKILENSKDYVKVGGILVYSTCTIDKRENIENIERFLNENKDFRLEKITLNNSKVKVQDNGTIEILPDDYECDGFFIAKLRKMEEKC